MLQHLHVYLCACAWPSLQLQVGYRELPGLKKRGGAPLPASPSTALSASLFCRYVLIFEVLGVEYWLNLVVKFDSESENLKLAR